jgi:transposase
LELLCNAALAHVKRELLFATTTGLEAQKGVPMDGTLARVPSRVKRWIQKRLKGTRDAGEYKRCLIIVNLLNRRSVSRTAEIVGVARSTVYRVVERFRAFGEAGLLDQREENGEMKLDERFLSTLDDLVRSSPQDHGWTRPTWTREMLVTTMKKKTGISVHVGTLSRALKQIRARRGRPRPAVKCPWSKTAKNKRIRRLRALVDNLPAKEVVVYADEVDIHLNPKIGLDWMGYGQQKVVITPGQNEKRYLAGAMNPKTGCVTWVEGDRKDSYLFIAMLYELRRTYQRAKVIHVILDNFRIHSSAITQTALKAMGGKVVLHFLPPYCPDENRIERLWLDLHSSVTRNHQCPDMPTLMRQVRTFLAKRSSSTMDRELRKAA